MHVLITGGAGFIGQKLAAALAAGGLQGRPLTRLTLFDVVEARRPAVSAETELQVVAGDISDPATVAALFETPPDIVYHLAAVVSAAAEADFDLGLRVNLTGTITLFEAIRRAGTAPRVIYASSIAVHGGEAPRVVQGGIELNPQTSYGTQKAMGELLLNDMSRRGMMDGIGLRLPTVVVRPGRPNAAASSFMSSIFREPLQGEAANCPVGRDFAVWHSAPRTVVRNLMHAAGVEGAAMGENRNVNLPGRTDTIGEMIDAMTRVAGPEAAARITWEPDPAIEAIVTGWRSEIRASKALGLGFIADDSFEDSVRTFLEDDHKDAAGPP